MKQVTLMSVFKQVFLHIESIWNRSGICIYFRTGEPNNSGDEDCAMMYESSGKWNDGKCSGALQFMCKKYSK